MSGMVGNEKGTEELGRERLTYDEQILREEVGQMGLASLSQQSPRQPIIGFAIVDDSDSDEEDDNADGDDYGEHRFFGNVVSSGPNEEGEQEDLTWDDEWSDSSSDSDDEHNRYSIYGAYFDLFTGTIKPLYRFVKPNPRTSCNGAAAALKEPISLLTKYRYQRLGCQSKYFQQAFPAPSKALWRARQARRGKPLKKVQNVDDQAVHWA